MSTESIESDRDAVCRLLSAAHERVKNVPHNAPLRDIYGRAACHAELCVDGDLGKAIASVLLMEVERLKAAKWNSPLGQLEPILFMALAVLDRTEQESP